eukprot:TRINITY_DN8384_c0_g1_i1.p2 TRINITY_DN8384_c0_g1~~TRINITY_DN8384_c0_g1_i1.p2  ORF type:complete len:227 (-),score=47.29 TRINITY_DN8384_c0_g1_i1:446-1087(-)
MQAFICFLISCNIGEIATIFFATLLGIPEPLTPLHLLWVNLVTDGPPATALGFNPPDPDAMTKPPRPRDEPILSAWLLTRYCVTGLYVGFATIGVFVHWYLSHGVSWDQLLHWKECTGWTGFTPTGLEVGPSGKINPCDIFTAAKGKPQSLSLSVLVMMEMLKALSAVVWTTPYCACRPGATPGSSLAWQCPPCCTSLSSTRQLLPTCSGWRL